MIEYAKNINKINNNSYFEKLSHKPTTKSFVVSQSFFVHAVDSWSKVLGKLLTILPSCHERVVIINNLYDEHGHGNINESHVYTFNNFIKSFNIQLSNNEKELTCNVINTFNKILFDMIDNKSWIYCCSVLGMIEFTYIDVSNLIHKYAKDYFNRDDIDHYKIHEELDYTHATELWQLVAPYYDSNYDEIIKGIDDGYNIMNQLYEGLSHYLNATTVSV